MSIGRVLNKEHFYRKIMQKVCTKSPDQLLHSRNSFKNEIFWKRLTLFFLSNPGPFNGQSYQKQKVSGTSAQALCRSWNKFRKIPVLVIYYLTKVWWCNVKQFLSYSKNHICKFMQVNSWHHKLFHFHLSFWIWKLWRGREKITKIWISREPKELFRWNKIHFS